MKAEVLHDGQLRLTAETGAESEVIRQWFSGPDASADRYRIGDHWQVANYHGDQPCAATFRILRVEG